MTRSTFKRDFLIPNFSCMMSRVKKTETRIMPTFSKLYLTAYNGVQTVGWSYILVQTIRTLLKDKCYLGLLNDCGPALWNNCGLGLLVFQSLAVLEVLHCICGLVPSSALITALQVASRVFQAWGIIYSLKEVQTSPYLAITLLAWGLTEVIRYSFYFVNLLGKSSSFLTWCRYNLFIGLYPAGVMGETGNVLTGLDTIKKSQMYSLPLPNSMNISFSFYYLNIFILLSYIPLFPKLYYHMVRQRRKMMDKEAKLKSK